MFAYLRALLMVPMIIAMPEAEAACVLNGGPAGPVAPAIMNRCNAPEPADGRVAAQQLDEIMAWLAERFGLPQADERPAIVFEAPADLERMRNGGFVNRAATQSTPDARHRFVRGNASALYSDLRRTIHLPEHWNGESDADMSVLVHEVVHHLQNVAGLRYRCAAERERLAYRAQDAWLRQSGKSLASEFGLDGLSVIVHSHCM
ncbi:MAG: DUF6647 family protein [Pseudomonadota bacterium]